MRVHFILNPNDGNGRAKKRWLQFNQQLSFPYELHVTQYVGHTLILTQDIAKLATKELPVCIVAIGGGMNLSPKSNTSDGNLEVTIVSNLSKWKLFFLFGNVFFAKHTRLKEVYQFETTGLEFEFSESVMAHADGERQLLKEDQNHITIKVSEKAWQLAK